MEARYHISATARQVELLGLTEGNTGMLSAYGLELVREKGRGSVVLSGSREAVELLKAKAEKLSAWGSDSIPYIAALRKMARHCAEMLRNGAIEPAGDLDTAIARAWEEIEAEDAAGFELPHLETLEERIAREWNAACAEMDAREEEEEAAKLAADLEAAKRCPFGCAGFPDADSRCNDCNEIHAPNGAKLRRISAHGFALLEAPDVFPQYLEAPARTLAELQRAFRIRP